MTDGQHDLYSILDIQAATTVNEKDLRAAYKRALLRHHPDKHGVTNTNPTVSVDQISLAYKILSDAKLRAEYDAVRRQDDNLLPTKFKIFHTGLDTFDLDDLSFDEHSGTWSKECRCGIGGGFVLSEAELESHIDDREIIVGCKGCSLWIRVLFSVEQ